MDRLFALWGKVVLGIIVIGGLIVTGYWIGNKDKTPVADTASQAQFTAIEVTPEPATETLFPTPAISNTPTQAPLQQLSGGVPKSGGLAFVQYTLQAPDGWIPTKESMPQTPTDKLTLTHGDYQISIYQAATGGALCLFTGDPAFDGPSSSYASFVQINSPNGMYRRGNNGAKDGKIGYTICQKNTDNYGAPTTFGHISVSTPAITDETIVKEIDDIIASLKKS